MQPHPHLLKLRPLLRRKNLLDLDVRLLELSADLRLHSAEDRVDALVVRVDDACDGVMLRRRQIEFVMVESIDEVLKQALSRDDVAAMATTNGSGAASVPQPVAEPAPGSLRARRARSSRPAARVRPFRGD